MERKKVTIPMLQRMKEKGDKITFITAYDYPFGLLADRAGVEMILVGDSLGMTVLGYDTTLPVTMEVMISHTQAVRRAVKFAFLVGDMPYMSYQPSAELAIKNAGRFMAEGGADGVKLEGGARVAHIVEAITNAGIPVMGHIGLTPQSLAQLGGFRVQGKDAETARALIEDAKTLEKAGAFSVLLECVPSEVSKVITQTLKVPVLGIGGGKFCDGQILIMHDMLGLFEKFVPKFVKKYANLGEIIIKAFKEYVSDVKTGKFPGPEHEYEISEEEVKRLLGE